MLTRVTSQMMMASAQRNLQSSNSLLAQRQEQASTLKAIGRPSDDPIGTASSMQVRAQAAAASQYSRNIDDGTSWLNTIDSSLTSTTNMMNQVRDLTVQGGNGSLNQAAKDALATQIEGLKSDLMGQANTQFQGRNVYAGTSDQGTTVKPVVVPADGTPGSKDTTNYNFAASGTVDRRIAPGSTVRVDADGSKIFGDDTNSAPGTTPSVFKLLDNITATLRAGGDPSSDLTAIDARMKTMTTAHAEMGTRQAQVLKAKDTNLALQNSLEAQRSGIEDLDLGKSVLDLQTQQVNYQAALAVTAKVLPQTLMDFLR